MAYQDACGANFLYPDTTAVITMWGQPILDFVQTRLLHSEGIQLDTSPSLKHLTIATASTIVPNKQQHLGGNLRTYHTTRRCVYKNRIKGLQSERM